MGILGKAVRVGTRTARTTVRAGRSVARGRVPGLSVGAGIAGFGVRVGTRGVGLRMPLASVKLGTSGFRTTVGVPGVAHLSVAPFKPSATLGVGPLRLRAARHPGVSLSSRFVSVGVTTAPLLWVRAGACRWAVATAVPQVGANWYDEVNAQWQPYYVRRPPQISAELHDLIINIEQAYTARAFTSVDVRKPGSLHRVHLTNDARRVDRRERRRTARRQTRFIARGPRRAALREAEQQHLAWVSDEIARLDREHDLATQAVENAWRNWNAGDPATAVLVANSLLTAVGSCAAVVSHDGSSVTLLVLAAHPDDVCPDRPSLTKNDNPTVKKRTKNEFYNAYMMMLGADVTLALRTTRAALRSVPSINVIVVTQRAAAHSLAAAPVIASFTHSTTAALPTSAGSLASFADSWFRGETHAFRSAAPDVVRPSANVEAVAVDVESLDDIGTARFWAEVGAAADHFRTATPPTAAVLAPAPPIGIQPPARKRAALPVAPQPTPPAVPPTSATAKVDRVRPVIPAKQPPPS